MEVTAPHLTHAMATLIPLNDAVTKRQAAVIRGGLLGGDLLRRGARTSKDTLPRPRQISATEALQMAPPLRKAGLRGAMLGWDGQLEDDARLVATVARTAASYGAHVRTHARVLERDRHLGVAARRAHRRRARGHRTHGHQRHRGLGRRPGRRDQAPPQPRHPPGAARGVDARAPGRRLRAGAGRDEPVRAGAAPARRHGVRRPHRRAGRRSGARRARADGARDRLPPRRGQRGVRAAAAPLRRGGRLRRPAAAARRRPAARPPTCPASTPRWSAAPAWSRSWAAS